MSGPRTPESIRQRRVRSPWRVVFTLYALALTTATHWPKLALGPEVPGTDKLIHALAFGALAFLLWQTRWIRRRVLVVALCLVWAVLDEVSQGIPGINRQMTAEDITANVLGVLVFGAWLWALRPVAGPDHAASWPLGRFVFEEVFGRWSTFALVFGAALACVLPLALLWPFLEPTGPGPVLFALLILLMVETAIFWRLWRGEMRRCRRVWPCLACGRSCQSVPLDVTGSASCPACAARVFVGHYHAVAPPAPHLLRNMALPALVLAAGIAAGFLAIRGVVAIHQYVVTHGDPSSWNPMQLILSYGRLSWALRQVIDLSWLLVLLAVAIRVYRRLAARALAAPFACRRCGHDLRGTPTLQGMGRCGECGAVFVRAAPSEAPRDDA